MDGHPAPAVRPGQEIPTARVGDRAEAARLADVIAARARREADAKGEAAGEVHFGRVVEFRGGRPSDTEGDAVNIASASSGDRPGGERRAGC